MFKWVRPNGFVKRVFKIAIQSFSVIDPPEVEGRHVKTQDRRGVIRSTASAAAPGEQVGRARGLWTERSCTGHVAPFDFASLRLS